MDPRQELISTLETLIEIVSRRLEELRRLDADDEYYRVRLALAFLLGLRDQRLKA
jgi:hypothetical protein